MTDASLRHLLLDIFSPQDLRLFLSDWPETLPIVVDLPGSSSSQSELTSAAVAGLRQHGLIDARLRARLLAARPFRRADIEQHFESAGIVPRSPGSHRMLVRWQQRQRSAWFSFDPEEPPWAWVDRVIEDWRLPTGPIKHELHLCFYRWELSVDGRPVRSELPVVGQEAMLQHYIELIPFGKGDDGASRTSLGPFRGGPDQVELAPYRALLDELIDA